MEEEVRRGEGEILLVGWVMEEWTPAESKDAQTWDDVNG
jgi:hypothetical protein